MPICKETTIDTNRKTPSDALKGSALSKAKSSDVIVTCL